MPKEAPNHYEIGEIDKFRNESELPHHWAKRKQFLLTHGGSMPTSKLICLSNVYINTECFGLTYPDEVMKQVKELASKIEEPAVVEDEQSSNDNHNHQRQATSRDFHNSNHHHHHHQQQQQPRDFQHRPRMSDNRVGRQQTNYREKDDTPKFNHYFRPNHQPVSSPYSHQPRSFNARPPRSYNNSYQQQRPQQGNHYQQQQQQPGNYQQANNPASSPSIPIFRPRGPRSEFSQRGPRRFGG